MEHINKERINDLMKVNIETSFNKDFGILMLDSEYMNSISELTINEKGEIEQQINIPCGRITFRGL